MRHIVRRIFLSDSGMGRIVAKIGPMGLPLNEALARRRVIGSINRLLIN